MTEAQRTAQLIQAGVPKLKQGTRRFWRQWFGCPHDNFNAITGASASGDVLVIMCDEGESLRVYEPVGGPVSVSRSADSLRSEGNAHGDRPGRRYFEEYHRRGRVIQASTDVDWCAPDLRHAGEAAAVDIA